MRIGLIGLGKMGGNMRERLRRGGVEVVGLDHNPDISDAKDEADLVAQLGAGPRVVWLMVPIHAVDSLIETLKPLLSAGDVVIDGGNSKWTHDAKHAAYLSDKGIHFVDVGTSGGVWGLENGYALMAGGPKEAIEIAMPAFQALKPEGEFGFVHAGESGAGHFAKMVHNGIEYGLMQAYAEGWELLEASDVVTNVPQVFESWREGTVIRSWLLDLMTYALGEDPHLEAIEGYAEDSGEGRWTVNAAVDLAVPVPTIAASLFARFVSRQDDSPAMKMVAAMRNQFGGHAVAPSKD
ncbi:MULTISPECIES: phosphogluconate dehydrogenase (NAD(+)-dependent, decarboxylating) [unclassified Tessaracoccus]|uniref:phosphogluconate dehydrogenase (NAD(+)-dependent, decarboxylating) n=1 Tax=unclassified Tessaracoccus TaxID=2635419 RepID=UPI001600F8F5|nr:MULTISPECIES: decarboxylating 6-phosphogluconate dehydrogenase [unclassified Tessaracoccus]MBB1511144.1 decarboxylating 6-phosphogluconate dehydrogenase [Tessaracoccus sp. MC1627]MBB1516902.1 decarboxylating 6-phosphogluconate dehydrogenase [Tessaracoccus sp. MC1679]